MRYILSLVLVLALAAPVLAAKSKSEPGSEPTGGFEGPVRGAETGTVAKALTLSQDAKIVLVGHIVASDAEGKNLYYFKDDSGEMPVVISPKQFRDLKINPEMTVRIVGKIDKGSTGNDAARLKVGRLEQVK